MAGRARLGAVLWCVPDGSQQPRVILLCSPSPWVLPAGVSCRTLCGQALYLWTLNFQGGNSCRDGALVSTGFESFPQQQDSFISGRVTSGANRLLRYSPGICKLDANVAFGCHDGAAMWLRLLVLASSM